MAGLRSLIRECGKAINGPPVWIEKWLIVLIVLLVLRAWLVGAL